MWPLTITLDNVNPNSRNWELRQENSNSVSTQPMRTWVPVFSWRYIISFNLHNPLR